MVGATQQNFSFMVERANVNCLSRLLRCMALASDVNWVVRVDSQTLSWGIPRLSLGRDHSGKFEKALLLTTAASEDFNSPAHWAQLPTGDSTRLNVLKQCSANYFLFDTINLSELKWSVFAASRGFHEGRVASSGGARISGRLIHKIIN